MSDLFGQDNLRMPISSDVPESKPVKSNLPQPERVREADRLEYVADLLLELQAIAVTCRCDTLAGLLALSHAEALRQARQL
jgi:hypothetical protein